MRTILTNDHLKVTVEGQLDQWVAAGKEFTAFDVTKALRDANPAVNIPHASADADTAGVRMLVKELMEPRLSGGTYDLEVRSFPSGMETVTAMVYVPVAPDADSDTAVDPATPALGIAIPDAPMPHQD
jgi:hypothetical protein